MLKPKFKKNRFCWICGNTVDLENCKVDEHGMPVHGDCYFLKVALASGIWLSIFPPIFREDHTPVETNL